jgi:4-aminobutyrate aminotransferase
VCIAAALATVDVLEREAIANAGSVGAHIMKRLKTWPAKHPMVGDVRGFGLMIGVEIVKDQKSRERAPKERDRIVDELAFERGLLLLGAGANTVRICPPLILTKEQADAGLDIIEQCLSEVEKR